MGITVQSVSKRFGSFQALDQVSLEIKTGSLVALLGPSGSGKSTLLRIIAGLELPDSGEIWLTGEQATQRSVQDRGIGFVFQHYALFKHLTVRQNIGFALELQKISKNQIRHRTSELLQLVQLEGLGDRYPSQLSGGQRQRVALARALAAQPKVLLLDEPFGALDAKVRKELRAWLRQLHHEVQVTTVFVTHDQEEAMEVADELVVMHQGRIEQVGTPADLYDHPQTPFVMSFLGPVNILPAITAFLPSHQSAEGDHIFLRPHHIAIQLDHQPDTIPVTITRIIHLGWEIQVELLLGSGQIINAYLSREEFESLRLTRQQTVYIKPREIKVFSPAAISLSS